jgi:membrane-bound ClpP family serine protease
MPKPGEMSTLKAWLAVLASLINDAIVLGLVFLGFWVFHVKITLVLIIVLVVVIAVYVVIMHRAIIPALRRRKMMGAEGMIGAVGQITEALDPEGTVMIAGEYWKAFGVNGRIETGRDVEVVAINGLVLDVKEKQRE